MIKFFPKKRNMTRFTTLQLIVLSLSYNLGYTQPIILPCKDAINIEMAIKSEYILSPLITRFSYDGSNTIIDFKVILNASNEDNRKKVLLIKRKIGDLKVSLNGTPLKYNLENCNCYWAAFEITSFIKDTNELSINDFIEKNHFNDYTKIISMPKIILSYLSIYTYTNNIDNSVRYATKFGIQNLKGEDQLPVSLFFDYSITDSLGTLKSISPRLLSLQSSKLVKTSAELLKSYDTNIESQIFNEPGNMAWDRKPKLWTSEIPYTYDFNFGLGYIIDGESYLDNYNLRKVGFRTIEIDKNGILKINSKKVNLDAVNVDFYSISNLASMEFLKGILIKMKKKFINTIILNREMPEEFYLLCDELGIFVIHNVVQSCSPKEALFLTTHASYIGSFLQEVNKGDSTKVKYKKNNLETKDYLFNYSQIRIQNKSTIGSLDDLTTLMNDLESSKQYRIPISIDTINLNKQMYLQLCSKLNFTPVEFTVRVEQFSEDVLVEEKTISNIMLKPGSCFRIESFNNSNISATENVHIKVVVIPKESQDMILLQENIISKTFSMQNNHK
jgi:hypothetical protein